MLCPKKYTYGLLLLLISLFTFTACEVNEYDEDYRYAREVIVGEWRVQEALPRTNGFMPYTPGSTMEFERYGRFAASYYHNSERELGEWHMLRRSDGQIYLRIKLPLNTGHYTILYANIDNIRDNYLRLYVEDQDENSYYTLILTRVF